MSLAAESLARQSGRLAGRPLRVLLATQASGGGVGRHFLDLAQGLAARDVQVVGIYAPRKLDMQFRQRLAAGGLPPMHEVNMRRAVHPFDVVDLYRLVRLARRLGPFDLVHGHSSKGGALARLAALQMGIPSVYTPHAIVTLDPALSAAERTCYGQIERWLAHRTAAIIAVSHDEAGHIRTLGLDHAKVHVVPNGIEPPLFSPRDEVRARLGFTSDEIVVGFIGRLTPQKAPEVLLDAFAAVSGQHSAVRLLIVGSGPLETEVRRRIERYGLASRVTLLGDVVGVDVMPAFDAFCLSSRYEGMPYVLLEAMSMGLPIVSTRVCGATMCVEPERNGLIVPADDVPALSAALALLVGNAQLRRRLGAASQEMASRYSAQQMVDQTLDVYAAVLAAQGQPQRRGSNASSA